MLLAHHLYDGLEDPAADETIAAAVLDVALAEMEDVFVAMWANLDRGERAAVVALADGFAPASRRVAEEHGTARSTMQRVVERLEADGQLVLRDDGQLRLLDPLFTEWLRRR
jgi:hypothetical protein